jgi:tellurite methyltransferase
LPHLPARARTLDVACGSGRNVAALAAAGARATGFDLLPDALERARRVAADRPAAPAFVVADATGPLPFRPRSFQLVTGFRYLDRALFPRLVDLLVPGGELWWETFNAAQAQFGHPRRPEFLLAPGELPRLCAAAGLDVLEAQEVEASPALSSVRARLASIPGSA